LPVIRPFQMQISDLPSGQFQVDAEFYAAVSGLLIHLGNGYRSG
jgi:hypothetical protein